MQPAPPRQKVSFVVDGMDSSPEASDVSSVPTQASTPEDFKTVLAQYGMKPGTLTEIRDELISIAREAGDMMINADPSVCIESNTKNNTSDRVTQTGNVTPCSPCSYKLIVL
jgi:myo-inositol-1(or 4)-monophosphatase